MVVGLRREKSTPVSDLFCIYLHLRNSFRHSGQCMNCEINLNDEMKQKFYKKYGMAFLHSNDSHTFIKLPVFCRLEAVFFMMFQKKEKAFYNCRTTRKAQHGQSF